MLDPDGGNTSTVLENITDVIVVQADGTQTALGLGGIWTLVCWTRWRSVRQLHRCAYFSIIGYLTAVQPRRKQFAKRFILVANSTRPKDAPSETPENEIE